MDGRMVLFVSGIVLIFALFIPMSMLQDSRSSRTTVNRPLRASSWQCPTFTLPQPPVGRYECVGRRQGTSNELQTCTLVCPPGMVTRPPGSSSARVTYRCHNGNWKDVSDLKKPHCAALSPVPLVEQKMAPPEIPNSLLHRYLNHSQGYLAMAYFFDRADVQLPGFHKYFLNMWEKSMAMARDIMSYINKRGGWIDLPDLARPAVTEQMHVALVQGHVGLAAMTMAIDMEKEAQGQIFKLIERIEKKRIDDPHLLHVLEDEHVGHKIKVIKELSDHVTQLSAMQKAGPADYELGEYQIDLSLQ